MDFRWPPPPDGRPDQYRPPAGRRPRTGRPALGPGTTELVATAHGVELERLVVGAGTPATVFAHGLASSIADTRPIGSAVAGAKVFFHFRGHGRSASPPGRWTYDDLARDLWAIAEESAATRAVGVSLGAAVLCRLLAEHPTRFERVVFFLPAAFDTARPAFTGARFAALVEAIEAGDAGTLAGMLRQEIPAEHRGTPAAWAYLRQQVDQFLRDGLAPGLAGLVDQIPVDDVTALRDVAVPALVIGCRNDDLHPADVAERLASALPDATLHMYPAPGVVWRHRADLRDRISGFLNA